MTSNEFSTTLVLWISLTEKTSATCDCMHRQWYKRLSMHDRIISTNANEPTYESAVLSTSPLASQDPSDTYQCNYTDYGAGGRATSKSTPKLLAICSCKNYMTKTTTCQPTLPTFRAHTALHGISLRWPIQLDPSRPLMCSIIMQHCVMGCSCAELQN